MKKLSLLTLTAATAMTMASSPLSVLASEGNSVLEKLEKNGYAVIVEKIDCEDNIENIIGRLEEELGKFDWDNCWPEVNLPESNPPAAPDTDGPSTPDTPESNLPDAPETDTPGTGTPDVPETENPGENESDTPETDTEELTFAQQVVKLVNEERAKAGLSELTLDTNVEAAAQVRAGEIKQLFSHTRPDGSKFSTALQEQGVNYKGAGENIAWGQKTPEAVMQAWMNSAGHRANILNARFTKIGVGYYQDANGTNYWTQLFTY